MKSKRVIVVAILVFLGIGATLVAKFNNGVDSKDVKYKYTFTEYFDTKINLVFYENVDDDISLIVEERLREIHDLTNIFDSNSNLSSLNSIKEIDYNKELADILSYSIDYYNDYSHEFNIALGPVVDVWKKQLDLCEYSNVCELPSDEEIFMASKNIDPNNIEITKHTISIMDDMKIDLGSVAKGYAADEVAKLLKKNGYKHFLINAGGNIIVTTKPNSNPYIISIIDPTDTSKSFMNLKLTNKAVVTSGDYVRFFTVEDKRYSHLISTKTLYPSTNFRSVTVITNSSMKADIWSTMLFGMSYEDGKKLVESEQDLEVVWYVNTDTIYKSSGVSKYEEK